MDGEDAGRKLDLRQQGAAAGSRVRKGSRAGGYEAHIVKKGCCPANRPTPASVAQ